MMRKKTLEEKNYLKLLGKHLRKMRRDRYLTIKFVAEHIKCNYSILQRIETQKTPVDPEVCIILSLAQLYNCEISDLITIKNDNLFPED